MPECPFCLSVTSELCRNLMTLISPSQQAAALGLKKRGQGLLLQTCCVFRPSLHADVISGSHFSKIPPQVAALGPGQFWVLSLKNTVD